MNHVLKALPVVTIAAAALLGTRPARAQCGTACSDASGGVNLPAGFDLSLPFAQGEQVQILSGYGPNGGSSLHCRTQDTGCANDYFALDLILPDYPSSGKGQPVLAAASGTVIAAGWGSSGWAAYGQRVYIEHDFNADGHTYTTLYAHLDSLNVTQGQKVNKGDVIGTLGQSCNGSQSCGNFSTPHVHFSLHRDSSFGGSGSGGSYAGRGVRPEPIDGATGISQGQVHTSQNGQTTPPPTTTCDLVIPFAETLVEDDTPCVDKVGTLDETTSGLGNHAYYATLDTPDPDYAKGAFWMLNFGQAGSYDVWAWIPTGLSSLTPEAVYKVQFAGTAQKVSIDQSAYAGSWAPLGTFGFAAGADQWVRLGDNYVAPANAGKTFAIDALKIAPASGSSGSGGSGWPDGGGGDAGSGWSGGTGSGGSSGNAAAPEIDSEAPGCACGQAGRAGSGSSALLLAALGLVLGGVLRARARSSRVAATR
jgi:hypothetical protein